MIVYCEECGFKNIIDKTCVQGESANIPCCQCGECLRFYGLKAEALEAAATKQDLRIVPQPEIIPPSPSSLTLKYENMIVLVDEICPRITIGRQKKNDIRIVHTQTSRVHAIIALGESGIYTLTDQSANGTYVRLGGSEAIIIRQETIPLTANGVIGLGYKVDVDSPDAIHLLFSSF